ncbi:MAG TPA: hypothetical protein VFP26_16115 [Gemmatimonadaceae bacterium]|jgi:VIT1/CCC1 family predicted Fe2+/Mn2+ transporter|nr:hypothetical protein [Gemmatimonadaceae bacterium]
MNNKTTLQIASLVSLFLLICHLTSDVIDQPVGHVKYPIPVIVFVVWLYATLMLSESVVGLIIMMLAGIIGAMMIVLHSPGFVVRNSEGYLFVWTMFTLATTGWFTAILAGRALWIRFRSRRSSR